MLPRLATIDAPLLAVVGGSTGAGKSTLVNSLVGRRVTSTGVIRPTTRAPVLVHHSDDARWFADDRILPGLARSSGSTNDSRSLQPGGRRLHSAGLAILDAPDIDSVVAENRQLAAQLLAAADLWLFVTSAARYADAVPWEFLRAAAERSAAVAVVLDRVPPRAMSDVPPHLGQLMSERGLAGSPLFAVPETAVDERGPAAGRRRPADPQLAGRAGPRSGQPGRGGLPDARRRDRGAGGAGAAARRRDGRATRGDRPLRAEVDHSYAEAVRTMQVQTADGTLLRGEVLARWHEFVGTGEFFRALEQKVSWLRDRIVAAFKGEPPGPEPEGCGGVRAGVAAAQRGRCCRGTGRGVVAGQRRRPGAARVRRTGPVPFLAGVPAGSGPGDPGLAGRRAGPRGRRGHEQAIQGAVPGPRRQRRRGCVDDRGLRPHRRAGRCRGRRGRRYGGAGPAGAGGGLR